MDDTMESSIQTYALNIEPRVAVVGVGGAGCSVIDHIYYSGANVETIAINTDRHSLKKIGADRKVLLCDSVTKGEGAKGDHELGRSCAMTHSEEISDALRGHDMVFIIAGMGGGTGTGAAPVIAELSQRLEMITFGIAINPFSFENGRCRVAREGVRRLKTMAPMTMVMENDLLLEQAPDATMEEAFTMASAGINDYISKSTRKVINAFLEQIALLEMDLGEPYGEWPAMDRDTIRILFP